MRRVPALYFRHVNGTFEPVRQVGGMLAYYLPHGNSGTSQVQAFPPGFRMLSGDVNLEDYPWPIPDPETPALQSDALSSQRARQQRALGFNCLTRHGQAEATLSRHALPSKSFIDANCDAGLRLELMFPSCWNGVDLDSPDHRAHLRFSSITLGDGDCPAGYEHRVPTMLFEHTYDVWRFRNFEGDFLLSNGDRSGDMISLL